jgi:tetratricopeptide (TPR) repeat protein
MDLSKSISLCMVVKNEAEFLERCFNSILPVVQEVILVDTGSSDDTLQIARRFNVRASRFPWRNDFSAARNLSLSLATLPWILVLDADEVLSPKDHGRLAVLLKSPDRVAYSLIQRNYVNGSGKLTWTQSWKPNMDEYEEGQGYAGYLDVPIVRLFPRHPAIRFSDCVHESVDESLTKTGFQIKASGLLLHHYGQVRTSERLKQKKDLYLELGQKKLKNNPSPRSHFELGIQYQELGYFEQAIQHFLEALHQSGEFRIADLYLGICFSKTGKPADARFHLCRAQDCFPCSAELHCELGLVNTKEGKVQEAIAAFKQALAIDAGHVAALCYLGSLLVGQDQAEEGTGLLERAVQIDSNHFDSWINLAAAYRKMGRPSTTLDCLERACALEPENSDVARQLARAYADAGRHADATQILNQAVNRNPGNEPLRMYWAALLSVSGQEGRGREVYESILRAGGKFATLAQKQLEKMDTRMTAERRS